MGLFRKRGRQAAERKNIMRSYPSRLAVAVLAWALVVTSAVAAETKKSTSLRITPIVLAVEKTQASIVTIRVPRPGGGKDLIGSGVIFDKRGFIVTNRHVVGGKKSVHVRLHDKTELVGNLVIEDEAWDLAVLQIHADRPLTELAFAPSADVMVGETVIAVGHPFGYHNTVSTGIVSAKGRAITMPSGHTITGLIQTDASINPGNSGGPLLNIDGELIGINVALREGAQGIAFAINAGTVQAVLSKRLSAVVVSNVDHGLKCGEQIDGGEADRQHVVVASVTGRQAGVEAGDKILAIGSQPVSNRFDVERALWFKKAGEQIEVKVVRQSREMTVRLTLLDGNGAAHVASLDDLEPVQVSTGAGYGVPASSRR
jgi:serine protease Do